MAHTKRKKSPVIPILLLILLLLAGITGWMLYTLWGDSRTVFHDVTLELGQPLTLQNFLTRQGNLSRASFVTDPSKLDLSQPGKTSVALKHGIKTYVVNLTVADTTPPTVSFLPEYSVPVTDPLPQAGALVESMEDASPLRVYYASQPEMPEDYSDVTATVVVEDTSGNRTEGTCTLHFTGWLKEGCTIELGEAPTAQMLLLYPDQDKHLLNPSSLSKLGESLGDHTITVETGNTSAQCTVTVVDTTPPSLTLQNVRRNPGKTAELKDFVVSASDLSGPPEVSFVTELPDFHKQGTYSITIEAKDSSGNTTRADAVLWVSSNLYAPKILGADKEMVLKKTDTPDFLSGVSAKDDIDPQCEVTVDTSELNMNKGGTYYITYSAIDSSGNVGTCQRKVIVEPDEEDTKAAVRELADTLPDDPEKIRDYVRDNITYSEQSIGDADPVYYGLTEKKGDSLVYANVLKALLEEKGHEAQLIWVTNKTHYWVIVKLEAGWRHMDATPSPQHQKISIMTDQERANNLNGRNWDRSQWPACN